MPTHSTPRWTIAAVRRFDIIYAQRRNPYMVAWWSASFPGFGHLLMYTNAIGVLLTLSEVIINTLANINLAMVYSFSGNFAMAKQVLHPGWLFGYMFIYFFAIWDSSTTSKFGLAFTGFSGGGFTYKAITVGKIERPHADSAR